MKLKYTCLCICLIIFQSLTTCAASQNTELLRKAKGSIQVDHTLFTEVLSDHVEKGMVDYQAIKQDPRFEEYIELLRNIDPYQIRADDFLSFWINVYNAFTIKVVCDNYPVKSITDLHTGGFYISHIIKKTIWDKEYIDLNDRKYTLNFIEHKLLRPYGDARIHFALVCAAKSCPSLRAEAYETNTLDEQLNEQARTFLSQENKNRFDFENNVVYLSKIFKWFSGDFKKNGQDVLDYVSQFLENKRAEYIRMNRNKINIKYTDYDWALNEKNELTFY